MAMLSSYTLLSRAPAPAPGPKLSPAATATATATRKQLPPPAVAALRWASSKESHRAPPLWVCHCQPQDKQDKYKYDDIQPSVLQSPPKSGGKDWNVMGDEDLVILKFRVGESVYKDKKVKIGTTEDQTHLTIRYTGHTNDDTQASKLNVQLALPPGYDGNKVRHMWFYGWLVVLIAKPKRDPIDSKEE